MKKLLTIAAVFVSVTTYAQTTIKIEELSAHIGDSITVCTTIYGGKFFDKPGNAPTLLNAGAAYPNSPLTLVIWSDLRAKYKTPPEELYKGKAVCIAGKVILFKEKPEIVIYAAEQIIMQ